jgi:hypothetical protein
MESRPCERMSVYWVQMEAGLPIYCSTRAFCVICHLSLAAGPTIQTTSGGVVHIRCAEGQAQLAARRRTIRAILSLVVLFVLLTISAVHLPIMLCVVLALLLIAAHVHINRRWWYYIVQSARLWWRFRA